MHLRATLQIITLIIVTFALKHLLKTRIKSTERFFEGLLLFRRKRCFGRDAEGVMQNLQQRLPPQLFDLNPQSIHSHSAADGEMQPQKSHAHQKADVKVIAIMMVIHAFVLIADLLKSQSV